MDVGMRKYKVTLTFEIADIKEEITDVKQAAEIISEEFLGDNEFFMNPNCKVELLYDSKKG